MKTTVDPSAASPGRIVALHESGTDIPFYVYAIVFSSFCVITGLIWDLPAHETQYAPNWYFRSDPNWEYHYKFLP